MRKPTRGRKSLREILERNNVADRFMAAMAGKPPQVQNLIPPKRERAAPKKDDSRPLERHVLAAVMEALRADPRVASVERNQSGVFQDGNRYIRVGSKGKLDLTVYLKSGRYAEIEVKRDSRAKPSGPQLQRIEDIRRKGGIAGWCWSPESALEILP